jgi:hypothetical protein
VRASAAPPSRTATAGACSSRASASASDTLGRSAANDHASWKLPRDSARLNWLQALPCEVTNTCSHERASARHRLLPQPGGFEGFA